MATQQAIGPDHAGIIAAIAARDLRLRAVAGLSDTPPTPDSLQVLGALVDGSSSRLSYWDTSYRSVFANRAFLDWFGAQPESSVGRHAREIIGDAWFTRIEPYLIDGLANRHGQLEAVVRSRDGIERNLDLRFIPDAPGGRVRGLIVIASDITAYREALRELASREIRFEMLLDAMPEVALFMLDARGHVATWNASAARQFGCSAEQAIGQPLQAFFATGDGSAEGAACDLARAAGEGRAVSSGWRLRADGTRLRASMQLTPVRDPADALIGYGCVTRDLSDHQQAAELQAALRVERERREASEQANRAKREFLASMSHEIRTPMNAILGLSSLALQHELPERPREFIQKAHAAAGNLLGILNDILDLSKVEAGRMQLECTPFVLGDVLGRITDTIAAKAESKGLRFTLALDPAVPHTLLGDPLRLGQVLLNLCDNAIKFTDRGEVVLQVEALLLLRKDVELLFTVGDTGRGIPPDRQRAIFDRFAQADASTTRHYGGTGLGLAISQQLVELMGGIMGVHSQQGTGSTFHFNARFQIVPDAPPAVSPGGPRASRLELRGAKVLLVEDNEVNQLVAVEMLRGVGIEPRVAVNGRDGLELLGMHPEIELVLMDCLMPVMDGFAATRAIRASSTLRALPVVAMTANVLSEDVANCRAAGMNDHIGKPFLADELFEVLTRWLPQRRVSRASGDAAPPLRG